MTVAMGTEFFSLHMLLVGCVGWNNAVGQALLDEIAEENNQ